MPEAAGPLLELADVCLSAGAVTLLGGVSFRVEAGTTTVVMGPAGSGKTSLAKVAAGILPPDGGELRVEGRPFDALSKRAVLDFRRRSGFVFQDAALWSNQSLFDNVAFPLRFHVPKSSSTEVGEAVARAIELAGYRRNLYLRPSDISAGERKMIGLARALVLDPELLFFDDPFSDLDEEEREALAALLAKLQAKGRTILLTGATPELARRMADRVLVIDGGRLQANGSYEEATAWSSVRGLQGRLLPRTGREGLVGVWEDTLSADAEQREPDGPAPEVS